MTRTKYIIYLLLTLLLLTFAGKGIFLYYDRELETFGMMDVVQVIMHGISMDMLAAACLSVIPWLVTMLTLIFPRLPLKRILALYFVVVLFCSCLVTGGDIVMYEYWKFKLDASIFSYMGEPGEVSACAPMGYVLSRIGLDFLAIILTSIFTIWLTPRRIQGVAGKGSKRKNSNTARDAFGMLGTGAVMAGMIALGLYLGEAPAYYSEKIFLNHASVNPLVHFGYSGVIYTTPLEKQYRFMEEEECNEIFSGMYPQDMTDIQDTLLRTQRPNILTIQLEGLAAPVIEALGGEEGVAPELSAWMKKGVNFDNAWANSFRTDRGTVSVISGYVAYPTTSLMLNDDCLEDLPSIPHSLTKAGYHTEYLYGGDPTVMNKDVYLRAMGFERVLGIEDIQVPKKERDSWGANDSISLTRLLGIMTHKNPDKPWYMGYQTISSHEPWVVPYSRLEDPVYNAFAYTDHCVGRFLNELSETPLWDNLLVIIFADHGCTYGINMQNPEFFHIPLFMVGGALREAKTVNKLISQNDIAATLLAQMGISHDDFEWSRNIFSNKYEKQFVYSCYPAGALYKDDTGLTMMDLQSQSDVDGKDDEQTQARMQKMKALIQKTYDKVPR